MNAVMLNNASLLTEVAGVMLMRRTRLASRGNRESCSTQNSCKSFDALAAFMYILISSSSVIVGAGRTVVVADGRRPHRAANFSSGVNLVADVVDV